MEKNIFIMGDSYSTFKGHIPRGYEHYYGCEASAQNGVSGVEKTWWHILINQMGYNLVINDSFSGSTICNTRYNGEYCPTTSFIGRLNRYIKDGFFDKNKIDSLFIFGGTNDSWADSPIGELQYQDWSEEDLKCVLPAFCYLMHRLKEKVSNVRVVVLLNTELKPEIVEGYKTACEKYGVEYIQFTEIDKINGHPTAKGMEQITSEIKEYLLNK